MDDNDRLAELLERWDDALRDGKPVTPGELCASAPDLLPAFERLVRVLGPVNAILSEASASPGPLEEAFPAGDVGRYRPLSHHASGGLGHVFLAEDTELHRTVALKRMHGLCALDPEARQRFLYEAEITSKLDHPGVVPVFGSGTDGKGKPYYAMRFIHGPTLADAVERFHRPTAVGGPERDFEFRKLLRSFISVCQTIGYAHTRGVIHRDLKPGNIMMGTYGETLVVDWGLAKRLGHKDGPRAAGEESLRLHTEGMIDKTVVGLAKGSPAYMSPEQSRGGSDRIGQASDIYSLGATLYVILTGKRPFDGKSAEDVLKQVQAGPPRPPRAVAPQVPAALDAICQKAMQPRPEDRYTSALDLVRDLEQWLADEPVSAWREPWPLRLRRWLKRHRTFVTAGTAALLVAGVVLAGSNVVISLKNVELSDKNAKLVELNMALETSNAQERKAREQAERFLALLLDSQKSQLLRDVLRKYSGQPDKQPQTAERLAELDALVQRYREALLTTPDNKALAEQTGYALYHRAKADPGSIADPAVRQRFDQALELLRTVREANPANLSATTWQGLTHYEMGSRWEQVGKMAEARREYEAARKLLQTAVDRGTPAQTTIILANLTLDLCALAEQIKEPGAAQLWEWCAQARQALEKARQAGPAGDNEPEALASLAKLRFNLIFLGARLGKVADPDVALAGLLGEMNDALKPARPFADFELVRARIRFLLAARHRHRKEYLPAVRLLDQAQVDLGLADAGQPDLRKETERVEAAFVGTVFQLAETANRADPKALSELRDYTQKALELVLRGEDRALRQTSGATPIQRMTLHQQREQLEALLKALGP